MILVHRTSHEFVLKPNTSRKRSLFKSIYYKSIPERQHSRIHEEKSSRQQTHPQMIK